ncbi:MAG: VOC family protein [Parcubacteria group bacterium]|jgi:hypothetical protein
MKNIISVIGDYKIFLNAVYANLKSAKVDVADFYIDHIAYRTTSQKNYRVIREELLNWGEIMTEKIIRNRLVSIFKFNIPLDYNDSKIEYFEILEPANDNNYKEGLEHAEFVVGKKFSELVSKNSQINFIFKDKEINPELVLKFPDNVNVKFHELPIDEVIKLEEK